MLVQDRQGSHTDVWIDIRPRWPRTPPAAGEFERLGLHLLGVSRVLRIEGGDALRAEHLAELFDPLAEELAGPEGDDGCLDVFCLPGVTDAEGETAARVLAYAGLPGLTCHAGARYRFAWPVPRDLRPVVERLLGNALIHHFIWHGEGEPPARNERGPAEEPVATVAVRDAGDGELFAISRRLSLALDREEMRTIAHYFRSIGREPTDVELQSIALTWSEHCSHKTFKATIQLDADGRQEIIRGLLAECLAAPTAQLGRRWVRSAFVDNAGVIALDRWHDLAFKVETHNHPSALEPYGGAHTGLGGVIRDVLAVSAEPIANTDVLCFGPPDLPADDVPAGAFHPARTYGEVVRGISDYGNNMGIPTVGGAVLFHRGYTANPLVFCGTLGLAPRGRHPREPRPGDAVVLLGGRTGRDGLHGATMSSEELDREAVAASTVQIGAPITEKLLRDVLPRLRDERLYSAITDCGAGGLCSAVGEMGERLGVEVDLARVPLKYQGLRPWEIWLSEAQERMVLAVPPERLSRLIELCRAHDVEATVLGRFRDDGMLCLSHDDRPVAGLRMSFMHGGRPARTLQARWISPREASYPAGEAPDPTGSLLALLAHPNIVSKERVIRRYDHEVGAATVLKPLTAGGGPSDAAMLRPTEGWHGVVVAHGINPLYGLSDPHGMAMLTVDEALRNLVAVGGSIDRAALLDNFCWGDVDDPDELGRLVRAAQGCRDASLAYGVPFISGKDSLRNTSVDAGGRHSIPGTLLISAVGVVPDVRRGVTMDLKQPGSLLYLLGLTSDDLGGSHYLVMRETEAGHVPRARPEVTRSIMRRLTRAMRRGLCLSCHDLSEGGLTVAAAEMAIAGRLGLELDLARVPADTAAAEPLLFGESSGRFLVEVPQEHESAFRRTMRGLPHAAIGAVSAESRLVITRHAERLIDISLGDLARAWKGDGADEAPENDSGDTVGRARALRSGPPPRGEGRRATGLRPGPPYTEPLEQPEQEAAHLAAHGLHEAVSMSARHGEVVAAPAIRGRAKVIVLAAAGVNCDRETVEACRLAGMDAELVHLNRLLAGERSLLDAGMLVFPGGFSYGDHLGAGAMLATVIRHRLLGDLQELVADGRPVLGICNGFQVLTRLDLLGDVALAPNAHGLFECRWVGLRVEPSPCIFLRGLDGLELPIAHGEGRVVVPEASLPDVLARSPLRYTRNPNGSVADIAGVCNAAGTVLGLMPHPERFVTPWHHPSRAGDPAGLRIFQNAARYITEGL